VLFVLLFLGGGRAGNGRSRSSVPCSGRSETGRERTLESSVGGADSDSFDAYPRGEMESLVNRELLRFDEVDGEVFVVGEDKLCFLIRGERVRGDFFLGPPLLDLFFSGGTGRVAAKFIVGTKRVVLSN